MSGAQLRAYIRLEAVCIGLGYLRFLNVEVLKLCALACSCSLMRRRLVALSLTLFEASSQRWWLSEAGRSY